MELGAEMLDTRGSGGARLAVTAEPIQFADELVSAGAELGSSLVARSSTTLEGAGEWAGAFTSYLDLTPGDVPKAVVGCWASAFSVSSLKRQEALAVEPGSFLMPVLVQPALEPAFGGTAELRLDGRIDVFGIEGSPAPLLQGWESGWAASANNESERSWEGAELSALLGNELLDSIADSLRRSHELFGYNRCEWAFDGRLWILQFDISAAGKSDEDPPTFMEAPTPELVQLARTTVRAPGKLGGELVLPWAIATVPPPGEPEALPPLAALEEATALSAGLTSGVWGSSAGSATETARRCIAGLLGPDPFDQLESLRSTKRPDERDSARLMSLLATVRTEIARLGVVADSEAAWHLSVEEIRAVFQDGIRPSLDRVGTARFEPFVASVVLASGTQHSGVAASTGIGAGLCVTVEAPDTIDVFTQRRVIVSSWPSPELASLLWDAAGLVTATGSPTAHLFEAARSLGVPAVTGVETDSGSNLIIAVDGNTGSVATLAA